MQQLIGLALLLADHAAAIAYRRLERFGEDLLGNLAAQGLEDFQFVFTGQASGSHFRILEITAGAGIGAVEQLLVGPFEVQQQAQGLAHPHVLEHRATEVVDEALHAGGVAVGNLFLDQPAFGDGRDVVGVGPVLGGHFQPEIELPGFQGLDRDGVVAVVVGGQHIEVVEAAIDRKVLAPIVLDPLIADRASGFHLGDPVGAAAQGGLQVTRVEVAISPPVLGQHRQLAEDQRQFTVVRVLELEQHLERVFGDDFGDVVVIAAEHRCAVLGQGLEAEDHVFGAYRMAVVEPGFGTQVETHPGIVRGFLDFFGEQAVFGEGFVEALLGQGVVDQADVISRHAFADERVEAVEAAKATLAEYPALGRVRVHIVEVLEIGRIFRWLVVQGQGVLRRGAGQPGEKQATGLQEQGA